MNRKVLFFGSFNPVHSGHIAIAEYVASMESVGSLYIIPSPKNPHKERSILSDPLERLNEARKAFSRISDKISVCDIEYHLPEPLYTINTLRELSSIEPESEFILLMGADNIAKIERWHCWREILDQYEIWVYPREGYDGESFCRKYAVSEKNKGIQFLYEAPLHNISSTRIRDYQKFVTHRIPKRFTLDSAFDSLKISCMVIEPDSEPESIIQLVHGMCEHKERYIPFMTFLADHGHLCIIHDHRGHGESLRSAEDYGYFYKGGYEAMIEDTRIVTEHIKHLYPDTKLSLLGHSMGSMVVRSYAKRYDRELSRLVICGSPSYNAASRIGVSIAGYIAKKYGERERSRMMQRLAFGKYNSSLKHPVSPNSWICSDPEVVKWYDANPRCNFIFTANGFKNLFLLMQDAYSTKKWSISSPDMPIMFFSGEEDPCLIDLKRFRKAVGFLQKRGYKNVTARLYPGMRHEILNEKGKEQVWNEMLDFLRSPIP